MGKISQAFNTDVIERQLASAIAVGERLMERCEASFAGTVILGLELPCYRSVITQCGMVGSRSLKEACAEYWFMLAVACAAAGRKAEGEEFLQWARKLPHLTSGYFYQRAGVYFGAVK